MNTYVSAASIPDLLRIKHSLCEYVLTNDFDMVALTETWLGSTVDKTCIGELVPSGYVMKHVPRRGRHGDSVALVYKSTISRRLLSSSRDGKFTHFEHMDCDVEIGSVSIPFCCVSAFHHPSKMGLRTPYSWRRNDQLL